MQASRFVAAIVAAQVLAQIGAFTLPALLPGYLARWQLSATEAGWLIGAFFAAYVAAVPVLVALTDRLPARRIYLLGTVLTAASHLGFAWLAEGFWSGLALRALAGIGWAGCYMPGLKALADRLEGAAQSRAVSWHAAGVGIAGAASFLVAGTLDALAGPEAAFLFGGIAALAACGIGAAVLPDARPARRPGALLDFRPVLRNRPAMAWIAGYTVHTWELAALRAWAVTFLALVIARQGAPGWLPGPNVLFTIAGLVGIAISILGNETSQRFGRGRVVAAAMGAAALLSLLTGFSALVSAPFAVACVLAWNAAIYLDSSALTAGTVQAAEPGLRGATMGLHSMCGYAGGFVGPIGVGVALDWAGPEALSSWGLAFGHVAVVTLLGLLVLRRLGRPA
ncbi:MFS transporter [Roseomonas frigidaquae]|uniref:MFS transporter n=1 Tax=Falsiroseomonas frigidaquae TaxID=487318 RepID=A0ABX1EZ41_9PROT|nr:MFS transporter [Falsiroseomonas frigidaquae]NKE45346.1 MFS transporter [Falsiroseomonas frigidaquae]